MSKRPDVLQAKMLAHFASSGIDAKTAKKLARPVTAEENFIVHKIKKPGYDIIYKDFEGKDTGNCRTRFFGTGFTKGIRYRSRPGCKNSFYFTPHVNVKWKKIASDTSTTIVFTEGERKAARACMLGIFTIGLAGVWSWRTRIAGVGQPLSDFDLFKWSGRVVELCFDSPDVTDNINVQAALAALATNLRSRGALVVQVILPTGDVGQKAGLDDYLLTHSANDYRALPRVEIQLLLDPTDPLRAAQAFLADRYHV